ncbi:MAG: hypothetical protein Q4D98_04520 [Planctomycetia bacterium]|nr:hypothetical protein [Planctomycetia bacterium]
MRLSHLVFVFLLWISPMVWGEESFRAEPVSLPGGSLLVAPHADSVVVVSRVWLITKGERVEGTLNGTPISWLPRFGNGTNVATLGLEIGKQKLVLGNDTVEFVLGRNDQDHSGPKEWQVYRLHNMKPGPNPCMECHVCEKSNDGISVGALNPPDKACFRCHEMKDITRQHANTKLEKNWLETCRDCHFLHASPNKYLLRKPRESYLK